MRDLERSRRFYADVLGWREVRGDMPVRFPAAAFSSGRTHHELLLIEVGPDAAPIPAGRRVGMYHFGLKVGESDEELRVALERLTQAGVKVVGASDHTVTHTSTSKTRTAMRSSCTSTCSPRCGGRIRPPSSHRSSRCGCKGRQKAGHTGFNGRGRGQEAGNLPTQEAEMPIVDDSTGEPVSDDPNQGDVEARGGKVEGDPGMQGASETGGGNVAEEKE